jgi:hypothetical protein
VNDLSSALFFFFEKKKQQTTRHLLSASSGNRGRWKIEGLFYFNLKLIFNLFLTQNIHKTPQTP